MNRLLLFLYLFFITFNSNALVDNFKFAREVRFNPLINFSEPIKGPAGTWMSVLSFKIGGLLKKEKRYCFYYKSPVGNNKGRFILASSNDEKCIWNPDIDVLREEDNIELLMISENKNEIKIKFLQNNRTKEIKSLLINHYKLIPGIQLLPEGAIVKSISTKKEIELCGKRNNKACIRKKKLDSSTNCVNMSDFYFCNPGTALSCSDQKVVCL